MDKIDNIDNGNCQKICDIDFYRLIDEIDNVYVILMSIVIDLSSGSPILIFIDCPCWVYTT